MIFERDEWTFKELRDTSGTIFRRDVISSILMQKLVCSKGVRAHFLQKSHIIDASH